MLILPNLILHKTRLKNYGKIGLYSILAFFPPLFVLCVFGLFFFRFFFFWLGIMLSTSSQTAATLDEAITEVALSSTKG